MYKMNDEITRITILIKNCKVIKFRVCYYNKLFIVCKNPLAKC